MPSVAAGTATIGGLDRLLRRDPARPKAERALDPEARQPALDLRVRARGEHRPRGDERHQ